MSQPPATADHPAQPGLRHAEWMTAATEEYRRIGALLTGLTDEDWHRPTDCAQWQVRDVVAHLVGAAESTARVGELVRQFLRGRRMRPGEPSVEGMNAVQVAERVAVGPAQLRRDLADAAARGVRARTRLPAPLRAVPVPFGPPLGTRRLGYLTDRIYTRDAWLHRVDLCRATGRPLQLTADHDGRIVADVAAEWASAHRQPCTLTLTGPAGGAWRRGTGGERLTLDAVEFCRVLSGRAAGEGLLAHGVPF